MFSATLGYSRLHRFVYSRTRTEDDVMACLLAVMAANGGTARTLVTDNMSSIVSSSASGRRVSARFARFAAAAGFELELARPRSPQTKGKVERTVQFVRDNFMIGIKYNSLADLNGQALAWCNKVNAKVHATTDEIPFERLKKEGLSLSKREYIIDKINLRRVQKDCLISYAGSQYSVPAEYVGRDVAAVALDNMLAAYYEGKQIALHRVSYQRKDMVVNPQHYRRLTMKQSIDAEMSSWSNTTSLTFP